MCANNESRNAGWQERGPEVLAFMADTLGSDTGLGTVAARRWRPRQ
jgi:hypothetical protein